MQRLDGTIHARAAKIDGTLVDGEVGQCGGEELELVDVERTKASAEGERRLSTEVRELAPVAAGGEPSASTTMRYARKAHQSDGPPLTAELPSPWSSVRRRTAISPFLTTLPPSPFHCRSSEASDW